MFAQQLFRSVTPAIQQAQRRGVSVIAGELKQKFNVKKFAISNFRIFVLF